MAGGSIRTTRLGTGVWVASLIGEQDMSTAGVVENDLRAMSRTGTGIVLDLSEATFMDSTIISAILAHRSEEFVLVIPTGGPIARIAALVGLDTAVRTYRSRFVACRAVAPGQRMVPAGDSGRDPAPAERPLRVPRDAPRAT
jgi:anti-anti-sigma regulatory factor